MSAPSCIVYFGIRREIPADETGPFEKRTHPLMVAARNERLQFYWANVDPLRGKYYYFVGLEVARIGPEEREEVVISEQELLRRIDEVRAKLRKLLPEAQPSLFAQWLADA